MDKHGINCHKYGIGDGLQFGFSERITYRIIDRWMDGENEWHYRVTCDVWFSESQIVQMPDADVVPVRHGTWIKADEQPYFRKHYHAKVCSECGKRKDGKWLYCPYCGSKNQDGGQDE